MSEAGKFVAECPLCRTKFTDNPGECPVCGTAPLKPILEAVAKARPIPVPTKRTLPPTAMRKRAKPLRKAPRHPPRRAPAAPAVPAAKGRRLPPRGPDGRFLPFARASPPAAHKPTPAVARPPAASAPAPALMAARTLRRTATVCKAAHLAAWKAARKPKSPIRRMLSWLESLIV